MLRSQFGSGYKKVKALAAGRECDTEEEWALAYSMPSTDRVLEVIPASIPKWELAPLLKTPIPILGANFQGKGPCCMQINMAYACLPNEKPMEHVQ